MDNESLDKLFPFHAIVSREGQVLRCGRSLSKACGVEIVSGKEITSYLKVLRPFWIHQFSDLINHSDSLIQFKSKETGVDLSGMALWYDNKKYFILYLTPFIESTEQLEELKLTYDDFSVFDTSIDNLALIQAQKGLLEDAKKKEAALLEKIETNDELKKANQSLDNFVYHVSHDLKSPVINLQSMLTMLKKTLGKSDNPRLDVILSHMETSITRFHETIHDFLELTRVSKGKVGQAERLNTKDLIEQCLENFQQDLTNCEAKVSLNLIESESNAIVFPKAAFTMVLNNLVSNAIKYRSNHRKLDLKVSTQKAEGFLVLSVQDNGKGMELDKHGNKVFAMFGRIDSEVKGSGVGLYMVKTILEEYEGQVSVISQINEGTTFQARFKL